MRFLIGFYAFHVKMLQAFLYIDYDIYVKSPDSEWILLGKLSNQSLPVHVKILGI